LLRSITDGCGKKPYANSLPEAVPFIEKNTAVIIPLKGRSLE
jgi:hypothetical protein